MNTLESLIRSAREAANQARWRDAERLWEEVRARDPGNSQALLSLGVHAAQRQDFEAAHSLVSLACAACPTDGLAQLMLANVRKNLGDAEGELKAINDALTIDPYFLPGVLAKAAWMDRRGRQGEAITFYRAALKIAPPSSAWPEALRPQLELARRRSQAHAEALERCLLDELGETISQLPPAHAERWREAIAIRAGRTAPFLSQSNQYAVPRLPAIPFFDRSLFAWAPELEAATDVIAAELAHLLEADAFAPYVSYAPGEPMNQFAQLNNSQQWAAFQLIKYGVRLEQNCVRCPQTLAALAAADLVDIPGCPNVMFSALGPRAHIPPHQGESNARVVVHLPLIVPKGCSYRVGFEQREWRRGQVLVFDDTIEHEARNDSGEVRIVLIFDVWNPLLSAEEREIARRVSKGVLTFPDRSEVSQ